MVNDIAYYYTLAVSQYYQPFLISINLADEK